jgi:hypothetical protein
MPKVARRGAELGARAQQQHADMMRPPLRRIAPPLRRELKPPTPAARARQPSRARPLLFASDWPALPHSSPSSGASTIGRICAATQRLRCESAASARCGGREAAKAGATAAAGIERLVRRRCRGVRIWAHAPLAPSGAVSRSCTRSSVGFLSALRECDARAALVPPQSAVAG